jgi:hypothetical protein
MTRRRKPQPDTRPRWNDPELECMAYNNRLRQWEIVSPEKRQGISAYQMQAKREPPHYMDPTYDMCVRSPSRLTRQARRLWLKGVY